ncbi:MAG: IPT/TIG domain-containing protein, partial [Planctomycetota bacterium]
ENVLQKIYNLRQAVTSDIPEEMSQHSQSPSNWETNVQNMEAFARNRTQIFVNHVMNSNTYDFPQSIEPVFSSVRPSVVTNLGDTSVTIRGARFEPNVRVYVDGRIGTVEYITDRWLEVTLPFHGSLDGVVDLRILNPSTNEQTIAAGALRVNLPVPVLNSLDPPTGRASGGERVTLRGENFLEGAEVYFGATLATEVVVEDNFEITALTPEGLGVTQVRVVNQVPRILPSEENLPFEFIPEGTNFVRGDANLDGTVDISDPVGILDSLFLGTGDLACPLSADANASRAVDLSDAVSILDYLFLQGEAIPAPFPDCGIDFESEEVLGCDASPSCS